MTTSVRSGTTLLELIVVLAVIAVMLAIVPAALLRPPMGRSPIGEWALAERRAQRDGAPVAVRDSAGTPILFLPDGRAVGVGRDPLTGAATDATR
jgi:prepilin-type N-terminal cleavage/methylation domain-containing protein